ncbi:MAG: organomercurial lyase, partial [Nitrospiraceae bacterium]
MLKEQRDLQDMATSIISLFPEEFLKLNVDEQRVSVQIYRLLAEGRPVSVKEIAAALDLPEDYVTTILKGWPGVFYDDEERIIGYWGLALPEMTHRFTIDGRTLYTWCAWDGLFIPELIKKTAHVESPCPVTGKK